MDTEFLSGVNIRPMTVGDVDAIVDIDLRVIGKSRPDYWKKIVPQNPQYPFSSLVAEYEDKVIGFVLGEVSGWEFGVPDTIGWLSIIGVDPDYQHKGVARRLSQEFVKNLKAIGVSVIYTLVNWNDWDLLKFFHEMGFTRGGDMINLELKID
ncbi:MAG: GNAT family N-acetyltransferase [Thermodesulfobacteriota bacterium]|nr:GNAT family N-acetyltransferase [Thermodesulfobacteriota bacterium]